VANKCNPFRVNRSTEITQGSPVMRGNPGLKDFNPVGICDPNLSPPGGLGGFEVSKLQRPLGGPRSRMRQKALKPPPTAGTAIEGSSQRVRLRLFGWNIDRAVECQSARSLPASRLFANTEPHPRTAVAPSCALITPKNAHSCPRDLFFVKQVGCGC